MASWFGIPNIVKAMKNKIDELKQEAVDQQKQAAGVLLERCFLHTPVWEGTTVRNFQFVSGGSGGFKEPIDTGPTGQTNQMALGEEPRRAANEAAARDEATAYLANLKDMTNITLTNTAPHWGLVDAGLAPDDNPHRPRNPGGVSVVALQDTEQIMKYWRRR